MCGIAGTTAPDPALLAALCGDLRHRGPDAEGTWTDPEGGVGLAHTRLAVIDLSPGGAQPMVSDCGRYVIAFNGEIYNYRTLRAELEAAGETFRSDSDTEVLLRLLRARGAAALDRLVGMFAFALWDRERRELLLVRDRLGIKPLVYAPLANGGLAFASEIRALHRHPGVDLELDREALSQYLACLYVPAPRTIHAGIRKLPPGHLLRWRGGAAEIECYWRPRVAGTATPSPDEAVEALLPILRRAVVDRMVADVPVGCFLSGGIDSSVIAALMAEETRAGGGPPVRSFTMTFDEPAYDERDAAAAVAGHLGCAHTELPAGAGLAGLLDGALGAFGEPFGNPTSLLIHDLSRKAREHVTVALVGDGGDEVFAGYPRYQGGLWAARYRHLPAWLRRGVLAPAAALIPESSRGRHALRRAREFLTAANLPDAEMYAAWVEYFDPVERRALLDLPAAPARPLADLYRAAPSAAPLDAMQQTDLLSFLPGNLLAYGDAMSMAHALELRLPLIDHRLVEAVQDLAPDLRWGGGLKTLLKGVARRLLPAQVVDRPKRGFNPPMGLWLKTDLRDMVGDLLTPAQMAAAGIAWAPVERLLAEQRRGLRDNALKVWALLVLAAWRRTM
ncbi:MAG: asparagine synthase (glutamine-hydrolyzing) [Hyphomicrobiales bacterium]|nr:asparagine synthase (glutamine-hydrolyzing) [Hyphomicrobiales bacterium]MCP5370512.1 asparagine synthase (glutamine-hydrolyzing) [Hyphomicrobiales bacterium]